MLLSQHSPSPSPETLNNLRVIVAGLLYMIEVDMLFLDTQSSLTDEVNIESGYDCRPPPSFYESTDMAGR